MSLLSRIASLGIGEVMSSAGKLALDLRTALTGDLTPEQKTRLQDAAMELEKKAQDVQAELTRLQAEIVLAESRGSWMQRSWRPILMLSIVAIIVNNYILFPYFSLFGLPATMLQLPEKLWSLMMIGVGGYVIGRSGEQIAKTKWKNVRD